MREDGNSIYTREQEIAREMAAKKATDVAYREQRHTSSQCVSEAATRQLARAVLEQRYEALLREANGIHALLRALPSEMSQVAEEALWRIVIDQRR